MLILDFNYYNLCIVNADTHLHLFLQKMQLVGNRVPYLNTSCYSRF